MGIENIMYFALGLLAASLVALIIMPAVWKRAVRLTKRRIEAATPITMAEFRADKDQLRAEFALSTRRLELNVETLRKRLAEQLSDVDRKRTDLGALKAERDQHLAVVSELEAREAELRARVTELERDGTDLAQRLRMRERELSSQADEVETLRQGLLGTQPAEGNANALTGDYERDTDQLLTALAIERKRASFLENQAKSLLARLESSDRRSAGSTAAIAQMRDALAQKDDVKAAETDSLVAAEARIASAENRLNAILAETGTVLQKTEDRANQLLADKLSLEDELDALRAKVEGVESTLLADWDTERVEEAHMRERLNDIAASVSRLVYAVESEKTVVHGAEESLFDKVQR
ncbi:MAG TPA: hypothetical protein VL133_02810, partial [Devosia sp.]|nr:hypothetical protein [Devosia sp.]